MRMNFSIIPGDFDHVMVEVFCPSCRMGTMVKAPVAGLKARENGALVQVAFPTLNADERELFVTGLCKGCFPKAPEEPEEDDEDEDEEFDCDDADDCEDDDCDGCGGCDEEE